MKDTTLFKLKELTDFKKFYILNIDQTTYQLSIVAENWIAHLKKVFERKKILDRLFSRKKTDLKTYSKLDWGFWTSALPQCQPVY